MGWYQWEWKGSTFCVGCAYGKSYIMSFPWKEHQEKAENIGDLVHYDLCGPINMPIVGGANYFVMFKMTILVSG
jgi:hypothetical protein